jgi:hypothetical protein
MNNNAASITVSSPRLLKQTLFAGYKAGRRWWGARTPDKIPFECGFCSQRFPTQWARDKHMRDVHE